jgi:hypothetical protein
MARKGTRRTAGNKQALRCSEAFAAFMPLRNLVLTNAFMKRASGQPANNQ